MATSRLDLFLRFCAAHLRVESGEPLAIEPFQELILEDYFSGVPELVVIACKKLGKSTLIAALALFELVTNADFRIAVSAQSRDQAQRLVDQATGMIARSPWLRERVKVTRREIRSLRDRGLIECLAADTDTADGWLGDRAFVDELHRAESIELYGILADGVRLRGGQIATISTAGQDAESPLGRMRQQAQQLPGHVADGAYKHVRTAGFAFHEWSCAADVPPDDFARIEEAHPASWVTPETLRAAYESPRMTSWYWARFYLGHWTGTEESWVTQELWDGCLSDLRIPEGATAIAGVDIGRKHDTSAVVVAARVEQRIVVEATVFESPGRGSDESQDLALVEEHLRELAQRYDLAEVAYDPWTFTRSAQLLADEGLPMVEYPQSHSRMAPASARLLDTVKTCRLAPPR